MKLMKTLLAATAFVTALSSMPANAATVFDSQALTNATSGEYTTPETRTSDANYAAVLQFSSNVTINQLGIYTAVDNAQSIKFLIFDSTYNGGTGSVLFSQTKAFAEDAVQKFIYTDPMSFTFLAGQTYDVGILGSTGTLTGFWSASNNLTQNGVTEISRNANITNFNSPTTGGYAGVTPYIQLNQVSGAVPEPATWAMMILGMSAVGFAMRRKMRASDAKFDAHIKAITYGTAA